MARIRIEELTPVEDLTQEELAEIFGAGLRSFRPTLDAMEGRQMMDAGLVNALLPPVAVQGMAQVRAMTPVQQQATPPQSMAVSPAADLDASMEPMYGALAATPPRSAAAPQSMTPQALQQSAGESILDQAKKTFKDMVGKGYNIWLVQQIVSAGQYEANGNIHVHMIVGYGFHGAGDPDQAKMTIELTFSNAGFRGGNVVYKATDVSVSNFSGTFLAPKSGLEKWIKSSFQHDFLHQRFDAQKFANGVAWQAEQIARQVGLRPTTTYEVRGVHPIDGGMRVEVHYYTDGSRNSHRYIMEFKYNDDDVSAGALKLKSVHSQDFNTINNPWGKPEGVGQGLENALKAAKWDPIPSYYNVQDVGKRFGEQALDALKNSGCSHPAVWHAEDAWGNVKNITRTGDGLLVELEVRRNIHRGDDKIQHQVIGAVTFALKHEGKVGGKDRFSVVRVDSNCRHEGMHDRGPYDMRVFNVSNEGLKERFASYTHTG